MEVQLHYILVFLTIFAIIVVQVYVFLNTRKKISVYKSIFPLSVSAYSIIEKLISIDDEDKENINDEELEDNITVEDCQEYIEGDEYFDNINNDNNSCYISQIQISSSNPTLLEIRKALNMYLEKNRGAASDFNLMKDVVERYCDAEEEEISIQQPIPLYLGLMGTMVGIIVGIGFIAFSGGLKASALMDNITALMTCVAIAMSASLVGILFTTIISWDSKNAVSKVEADKNKFYSWLQTELLPVLSGNTGNALFLLQQNLMTFNQTFKTNILGLDSALSNIRSSSQEQIELIKLIRDIDIRRVAQANVTVLKELRECTGEISVFNQYLHNVSGYLNAVNELNGKINEHLDRTSAIERMGVFFEREINQVKSREQYINEVVANVDNTLKKTFENLSESTKQNVNQLRDNSVAEFQELQKHYFSQKEEFDKSLQEQQEKFLEKYAENTEFLREIKKLGEVKTVMSQLLDSTKSQTSLLEKLNSNIIHLKSHDLDNGYNYKDRGENANLKFPQSIIFMNVFISVIAFLTFAIYIYNSFPEFFTF